MQASNPAAIALSIVTPCYNEQAGLEAFHERTCRAAAKFCDDFELVLVDDGSRDATWTIIEALVARDVATDGEPAIGGAHRLA